MCISGCTPSNPRTKGPGPVDCTQESCPAQRDFLITYGDPGLANHNAGRLFELAALTHEREVQNGTFPGVPRFIKGRDKIIRRHISTASDLASAVSSLKSIAYLSYFGHSWSQIDTPGALLIGEADAAGTNLTHAPGANNTPPTIISAVTFRADGQVRLFGCRGGYGRDSIARQLADQLRIPVYAYTNAGGSLFTADSRLGYGLRTTTQADIDAKLPRKGDVWLIPANGKPTFGRF